MVELRRVSLDELPTAPVTLPLRRAQAEDYSLVDAPGGCVLYWTFALWPYVPAAAARAIARPVLSVLARRMAVGLAR